MGKQESHFTPVRPASLALLEGTFGLLAGAIIALLAWISATVGFDLNTDTVLQGLLLGMVPGLAAVIALALVYCAAGVLVGYAHGALYNQLVTWSERSQAMDAPTREDVEPESAALRVRAAQRRAEPTFGERIDRRHMR